MILHTVNKSPFEKNSLNSCLNCAAEGSAVLLIEDGVYGALNGSTVADKVKDAMGKVTIYALGPDLDARGIADKVIDGIKVVDYAGFVALAAENDKVQSWL
jgi:tRNA 2-thiouridine synthesizing protein B